MHKNCGESCRGKPADRADLPERLRAGPLKALDHLGGKPTDGSKLEQFRHP
jgi:hypothetical protein